MFYREYKPTCVETPFGKPPPKFKTRVIVPETKNLDLRKCKCCFCSNHNRRTQRIEDKYVGSDSISSGNSKCKVCKKRCLDMKNKKSYMLRTNKDNLKQKTKEIKQKRCYECYCSTYCERDKEQNYDTGRVVKETKFYSEPACSVCEAEEREGRQFCNICEQWERITEPSPANGVYSSKVYENVDNDETSEQLVEEREKETCHFIIEHCKICGRGQGAAEENNLRRDDRCQELKVTPEQFTDLCETGRAIDECTRKQGFFIVAPGPNVEPSKSGHEDKQMAEEKIRKKEADCTEEEITLKRSCKICETENSLHRNCEANVYTKPRNVLDSSSKFKKAYSSSALQNLKKDHNTFLEEHLEEYKQQLVAELKKLTKNGNKPTKFRLCDCEHSRKHCKDDKKRGLEIDESEMKMIREKCNEAIAKVDQCKKEIAENNEVKCKCDHVSTMMILQDCKGRCDQLERKVTKLQQALNYYAHNNRSMDYEAADNVQGRGLRQDRELGKDVRIKNEEGKRRNPVGNINMSHSGPRTQLSKRKDKKSRDTWPRTRCVTCYHMRCYPPEQLADIPSFKDCPGFPDLTSHLANGRRVI